MNTVEFARRLYWTPATHRTTPEAVARRMVRLRAERLWTYDPVVRENALLHMRFLLGKVCDDGRIEAAARSYVHESMKRRELRWRPWLNTRQPVTGIERLQAELASGRGAVLSLVHMDQFVGAFASVRRAGVPLHIPTHPILHSDQADRQMRWDLHTMSLGGEIFPASKGSYQHMCDQLDRGGVVAIAPDLPGSNPVTVLGRTVGVASGAARLAYEKGVALFPMTVRRAADGWHATLCVEEPLVRPPADTQQDLLQRLFQRFEPALLAWPASVEQPLKRWCPLGDDVAGFRLPETQMDALRV